MPNDLKLEKYKPAKNLSWDASTKDSKKLSVYTSLHLDEAAKTYGGHELRHPLSCFVSSTLV